MLLAWSFSASSTTAIFSLIKQLGKHRYVKEVDHRLHFTVDEALRTLPLFAERAARFDALARECPDLDKTSRDPRLWVSATAEEVVAALEVFWSGGDDAVAFGDKLAELHRSLGFELPDHDVFETDAENPPFPELVMLDWVLLPVDALDSERHQGALGALEESEEPIENPSDPIYQEGPCLSIVELVEGADEGELLDDFLIWSEGPYAYADYVFRGAAKAAKLAEPPIGYRDLEAM